MFDVTGLLAPVEHGIVLHAEVASAVPANTVPVNAEPVTADPTSAEPTKVEHGEGYTEPHAYGERESFIDLNPLTICLCNTTLAAM